VVDGGKEIRHGTCRASSKRESSLDNLNLETSKLENFKNSGMDNVKLNHTSHSYPTKPEATDLNTIDIWLPKSKSPSNEDRKTWVMCVKVLLQPVAG
jgi:hypothetical protein